MEDYAKAARALFEQGYNCAQAVAGAFAPLIGLPLETVVKFASPFGGGIGRMREVCGAVSGMYMVLGWLYGYDDPAATEEKKNLYADVQELAEKFRQKNGSIICRELLGLRQGADDPKPAERTPAYYHDRRCGDMVETAATILGEYIAAHS